MNAKEGLGVCAFCVVLHVAVVGIYIHIVVLVPSQYTFVKKKEK